MAIDNYKLGELMRQDFESITEIEEWLKSRKLRNVPEFVMLLASLRRVDPALGQMTVKTLEALFIFGFHFGREYQRSEAAESQMKEAAARVPNQSDLHA